MWNPCGMGLGFASPDSDYDVRFIYVRRQNDYLRLDKHRDVCEWCPDEAPDINGWDSDKTLRLFRTSNPTLFEWLSSPIVYCRHPAFDSLMQGVNERFLSKSGLYHYLHMSNYRESLKGDMVKLKKHLYVLLWKLFTLMRRKLLSLYGGCGKVVYCGGLGKLTRFIPAKSRGHTFNRLITQSIQANAYRVAPIRDGGLYSRRFSAVRRFLWYNHYYT